MVKNLKVHKTKNRIIVATACVFIITLLLNWLGVFSYLENKSYDDRMQKTARFNPASDNIVFVMLDQNSLDWAKTERGWSWPWPRASYGEIVHYFNEAGANSVSFDVLYTEPSVYGKADDEAFATANRDFGKTILAVDFAEVNTTNGIEYEPILPIEPIKSSARILANVQSAKDSDDVIRRSRYGVICEGVLFPTLGIASSFISDTNTSSNALEIAKIAELINTDTTVQIRFASSIDDYIPYSAKQILQSYEMVQKCQKEGITTNYGESGYFKNLLEPELFNGADVFFGFYAPGLYDICSTPVSQVYPGVGVHLSLLDTLENNTEIKKIPNVLAIFVFLLCALLAVMPVLLFRNISGKIISAVIGCIFVVGGIYVLFIPGIWVPLIASLFCYIFTFLAGTIVEFQAVGRQRRYLKNAFSQYLSPVVIEKLINQPELLKLGGERREISIYFSDIQGFTSISERLQPEDLTALLNDYLTEMSNIILENGGTIDKYEGDAVIAFWNAPTDEPDHAKRAVEAAMNCQLRLAELRTQLEKRAGGVMRQRIGLNTGYAIVGNLGSDKRFDYTMLGDAVNLAARLEGLNKQFGTYFMCTDALRKAALEHGCTLCFRELARAVVVGKKEAVTVYEPMTIEEFEARKVKLALFDTARNMYYSGDFAKALKLFKSINADVADSRISDAVFQDPAAEKYADKCRNLIDYFGCNAVHESFMPEAKNWRGAWVATSK